eukprot:scaffold68331_cov12-Tisochrysis_lutea.AAC.1
MEVTGTYFGYLPALTGGRERGFDFPAPQGQIGVTSSSSLRLYDFQINKEILFKDPRLRIRVYRKSGWVEVCHDTAQEFPRPIDDHPYHSENLPEGAI